MSTPPEGSQATWTASVSLSGTSTGNDRTRCRSSAVATLARVSIRFFAPSPSSRREITYWVVFLRSASSRWLSLASPSHLGTFVAALPTECGEQNDPALFREPIRDPTSGCTEREPDLVSERCQSSGRGVRARPSKWWISTGIGESLGPRRTNPSANAWTASLTPASKGANRAAVRASSARPWR